jgi:sugar O-acyltransferase (sialic acid O-acetyltransferase NeuD family)
MLIVGAKGFAKEVLEVVGDLEKIENLCFYDDVTANGPDKLFGKFKIFKNEVEVLDFFKNNDSNFTLGIGNPKLRYSLTQKFLALGGKLKSTISKRAEIGTFGINIGEGCNILSGSRISNDVSIGRGCIVYYNCVITHDVQIGNYVEISPSAILLGRCKIADFVQIGAGAIIFPDVQIGENSIIGAGAVVKSNIPKNCTAVGVPSKVIKYH